MTMHEPKQPTPSGHGEDEPRAHPIAHGSDIGDGPREEELIGTSAHLPQPDRRPEEPSGESTESSELR